MYRKTGTMLMLILQITAAAADRVGADQAATREQATAILNELKQIRTLLEKAQTPPAAAPAPEPVGKATLDLERDPSLGSKEAPLTIMEFADYQCGFCRQFQVTTFPEIRKNYIDAGKVRFVARDLPLDFHNNAFLAAEAARRAGDQGQFWSMRDTLVTNSSTLAPDNLNDFAHGLYLDMAKFRGYLDGHKYRDVVRKEIAEAASLKIEGTPTFVIGKTTPEGVDGVIIVGALPFAAFDARLKELEPAK